MDILSALIEFLIISISLISGSIIKLLKIFSLKINGVQTKQTKKNHHIKKYKSILFRNSAILPPNHSRPLKITILDNLISILFQILVLSPSKRHQNQYKLRQSQQMWIIILILLDLTEINQLTKQLIFKQTHSKQIPLEITIFKISRKINKICWINKISPQTIMEETIIIMIFWAKNNNKNLKISVKSNQQNKHKKDF